MEDVAKRAVKLPWKVLRNLSQVICDTSVPTEQLLIPVDMLTRSNVFRAPEQKLYVSRGTVMVKLTSHHVELALAATFHKAQGTFVKFVLNRLSCSLIPYRTNDGTCYC